jgi:hypothetical protein
MLIGALGCNVAWGIIDAICLSVGTGDKLRLDATLMAGGVVGDTRGAAPGYKLTLTYGRFEFYSEGEYVFDTDDSADNFFYNWAQLGYSPLDWLSNGLASQRTRTYQTELHIQRGALRCSCIMRGSRRRCDTRDVINRFEALQRRAPFGIPCFGREPWRAGQEPEGRTIASFCPPTRRSPGPG